MIFQAEALKQRLLHHRPNKLNSTWRCPGSTVLALFVLLGPDDVFTRIATFFSQMAVVGFGGAYAVLAYVLRKWSALTAGSGPVKCSTGSAWPRPRQGR